MFDDKMTFFMLFGVLVAWHMFLGMILTVLVVSFLAFVLGIENDWLFVFVLCLCEYLTVCGFILKVYNAYKNR